MKSNKTTLILIVILGLALGAYYFLIPRNTETVDSVSNAAIGAEAISTLNKLQAIQLDFSILDDPAFNYLKNIAAPALNLPVGRDNPFSSVR